jgi:uncharacterized protein (TIGR03067 family)
MKSPSMPKGRTNMQSRLLPCLALVFVLAFVMGAIPVPPDDSDSLQGIWTAQSMEADGKAAPANAVSRMRFTFQGKKLLVKGNSPDDREEQCSYKIDTTKSPNCLDFTPTKEKKTVLAIYEVKEDELKVCLRHEGSPGGRPTEFSTKPDSGLVLIVFKKAK